MPGALTRSQLEYSVVHGSSRYSGGGYAELEMVGIASNFKDNKWSRETSIIRILPVSHA